jgi:hypothetical protein
VDPHVPDDPAGGDDATHDNDPDPHAIMPGQQATDADSAPADQPPAITESDPQIAEVEHGVPWANRSGGPAVLWRLYFDTGTEALELAEHLVELCRPHGVTVGIKGIDEYLDHRELAGVHGVLCVFTSEPPDSPRPGVPDRFLTIVRDFRADNPITAVDGFYPDSDRWHRVRVVQVFYTDQALNDEACAGHPYTPGVPFTGNVFEIFEPGKAEQVKDNDRAAATQINHWKRLRRWGIDTIDRARTIRDEIEHEVHRLEDPGKRAMYRPIPTEDHNQLWLVLHKTNTRPPANPNKTDEENHKTGELFVANGARAVRKLVERLEDTYDWFRQPEDLKVRGAQEHFARLYNILRTITRHS